MFFFFAYGIEINPQIPQVKNEGIDQYCKRIFVIEIQVFRTVNFYKEKPHDSNDVYMINQEAPHQYIYTFSFPVSLSCKNETTEQRK
jgi:hypothetical protein